MVDLVKIKEKADTLIGSRVSVTLLGQNNQFYYDSLILKNNRIVEEKKMVLSYFEDCSLCVNALTILNPSLYEIMEVEEEEEA